MIDYRARIRKHLPIFEAWINGKDIEFYSPEEKRWKLTKTPAFHPNTLYRIAEDPSGETFEEEDPTFISREGVHTHRALFDKWLNGEDVEFYSDAMGDWIPVHAPIFAPDLEYRLTKAKEKENA